MAEFRCIEAKNGRTWRTWMDLDGLGIFGWFVCVSSFSGGRFWRLIAFESSVRSTVGTRFMLFVLCIMSQQKPLLSAACEQLSTMSSALWRLNENIHLVFLLFENGGPRRNMSDAGQQWREVKFACGLYIPLRWTLQPLQLCDFLKLSGHHKPISCGKHSTIIQIQLEVSMVPSSRAMYWSGVVTSRVQHVLAKDLSTEWIRRQIFSSWWRICNVSSTGLRWLRGDTCACWSLIWFLIQGYTL